MSDEKGDMRIPIYYVNAFISDGCSGNPAAVCLLEDWVEADRMQKLAFRNSLSETAFIIGRDDRYEIRWFTPEIEIDLCGHATLASAFVIKTFLEKELQGLTFLSKSGSLPISFHGSYIEMEFPSRPPEPCRLPHVIKDAVSVQPLKTLKARDYVLVYEAEEDIRKLAIDEKSVGKINLDPGGIAVTARGSDADFVSRFFTPGASVFEDPVTGSAHCSLVPLWSGVLGKKELRALQLSERGGELFCRYGGESVFIAGKAEVTEQGRIEI